MNLRFNMHASGAEGVCSDRNAAGAIRGDSPPDSGDEGGVPRAEPARFWISKLVLGLGARRAGFCAPSPREHFHETPDFNRRVLID